MMVNVGIEYDITGYIKSAIWWRPGLKPEGLSDKDYEKYKIVNSCTVRHVFNGEDLYGVAMKYDGHNKELLGECVFKRDDEAYNYIPQSAQVKMCRTIKILYWDESINKTKNAGSISYYMLTPDNLYTLENGIDYMRMLLNDIRSFILNSNKEDIPNISDKFNMAVMACENAAKILENIKNRDNGG